MAVFSLGPLIAGNKDESNKTARRILTTEKTMNTKVKLLFVSLLAISLVTLAFGQVKSEAQKPTTANLQVTQCALKVSGMTCGGCAGMVKQALLKLDGVKAAAVDYQTGAAKVEYDSKKITPKKIVAAFNQASSGFRVELSQSKAK